MTDSWDRRAARLQDKVRKDEAETDMDYDDSHVRRSVVLVREDIVMMVSYLSTANSYLASIRATLAVAVLLLAYIAYKLTYH